MPGRQGGVYGRQACAEDVAVLADEDALEERLIEEAALQRVAGEVGRVGRLGFVERFLERRCDVLGLQPGRGEQGLGFALLDFQALLLLGEDGVADQALVGELHEPRLVVLQLFDPALLALDVAANDGSSLVGIALHVGPDRLADAIVEADGPVVLGDRLLDHVDRIVAGVAPAAGAAGEAVGAAEVLVEAAVTAMTAVEQPPAAFRAVERAPQVVVVLMWTVASDGSSHQDGLNAVEGVPVHQWLMSATNTPSAILDDADVVDVPQHLVDAPLTDRCRATLGAASATQTLRLEVFGERAERPVSGGVEVEGELDERGALGIDLDCADVLVADQFAPGAIPDRRLEWGSSAQVLAVESLVDLGGEVVGVVLREGGEHPVHETPGGCCVDVLARRDQCDAHALEPLVEDRIIQPVTREPVDLVYDQILDVERGQLGEHFLQDRTVVALG